MTAGAGPVRRLVCVSVNAAIDKTAAVPRLVPGEIHRPEMLSVLPGGKALNVARAARTLGLEASVIAVLGGFAGDWMEAFYTSSPIRRAMPSKVGCHSAARLLAHCR